MKRILFSPIGDTDPIRGCYDGACLHILRYYKPELVVLFYTAEMAEKEDNDHRYTKVIRHYFSEDELALREIRTNIVKAHLLDEFISNIPDTVRALHNEFPGAEILLNLSSGTPAIKSVMTLLSVEFGWCRGIQVSTPQNKSNKENTAAKDETPELLIETNIDNEPDSKNRCSEPPLKTIHLYGLKQQIISLVKQYEYGSALQLIKDDKNYISKNTIKLLKHASYRMNLESEKAKKELKTYFDKKTNKNINLFPISDEARFSSEAELLEYFLLMQINQKKEQYSSLLLKAVPFLYVLLQDYLKINACFKLDEIGQKNNSSFHLSRQMIQKKHPQLLRLLDEEFESKGLIDGKELSSMILNVLSCYIYESELCKDLKMAEDVKNLLSKIEFKKFNKLRNEAAHELINVTKVKFAERTGMDSPKFIKLLWELFTRVYEDKKLEKCRGLYDDLNEWIIESLNESGKIKLEN